MKKASVFIILVLVITIFTSCSTQSTQDSFTDRMVNLLKKQVGKPRDKVFSKLKLDESKDFTIHELYPSTYTFNEPKDFFGEEYSLML